MLKRILAVLTVTLFAVCLVTLSGCGVISQFLESDPKYGNRYEMDEQLADGILDDLSAGDMESFKNRFSYYCRNYHSDFDLRVEEIFDTLGTSSSYTYSTGLESTDNHYGEGSRLLCFSLELKTDSDDYFMYIEWYPVNDFDPNYEGICYLYAGTQDVFELMPDRVVTNGIWHAEYMTKTMGLYPESKSQDAYGKKDQTIASEYINAIHDAFEDNDRDALGSLFCANAGGNLDEDIDKFFEYLPDEKYLEMLPYSSEDMTSPFHTIRQHAFSADSTGVKEYYRAVGDMLYKDYRLIMIYCTRDDADENNVGLNWMLFYPSGLYSNLYLDYDALDGFEKGIYCGEECAQFFVEE